MKRIISTVLVCVLIVGCMLVLASCGGPNSDPKKAKAALEDAGYEVVLADDKLTIGLMSLGVDGITAVVTGVKEDEAVSIFYFESKDDAADAFDDLQNLLDEAEDEDAEYEIKQSGKMIWMGTKAAIKAAK